MQFSDIYNFFAFPAGWLRRNIREYHSEMIALILSILFPGLGQFYYGKNIRAICMLLLGLTPLYPAVLIWTIVDIIILNPKNTPPRYTSRRATWTVMILVVIIPVLMIITGSGLFRLSRWYSDRFVLPEQTKTEGRAIASAIHAFQETNGQFPAGIDVLIKGYPLRAGWITDSWKEPYIFEIMENQEEFRLISKGRDKQSGTADDLVFK